MQAIHLTRNWSWLRRLSMCGFGLMILLGALLPIYSDEIGWRLQERAWIDGVDKGFNDLCGPNTLAVPPWFMMPARWYSAMVNQALADTLYIRIEGLVCLGAWIAMLFVLLRQIEVERIRRVKVHALLFALLALGTLPLMMVMSRPEQPLLLTSTLAIITVFAPMTRFRPVAAAWVRSSIIVLLATIAASYHPKGIVFAPVAMACLLVCGKGRETVLPRVLGMGLVVAMVVSALIYWTGRLQCTGDLVLAEKLASQSIVASFASGLPVSDLLAQIVFGSSPLNYMLLAVPENEPMSYWIPANLFPVPVVYLGMALIAIFWTWVLVMAALQLGRVIKRAGWSALLQPRVIIALAIMACIMVWGASQPARNVYEMAQIGPMLVIFVALCFSLPVPGSVQFRIAGDRLVQFSVFAALVSVLTMAILVGPQLIAASKDSGVLPKQLASVGVFGYDQVRSDVHSAMKQAGMDPSKPYKKLLIDDVTYLALQQHALPFHRFGVLDVWQGQIENPAEYLKSRGSDGVVVGCLNLPTSMETVAAKSGEICAINKDQLAMLAEPLPDIFGDEQ